MFKVWLSFCHSGPQLLVYNRNWLCLAFIYSHFKIASLILVFCFHASDMNEAGPEQLAEKFFYAYPWDASLAWHRINTSNPDLLLCSPSGCGQWKHLMPSGAAWIARGLGIEDSSFPLPNFWHKPYHSPIPCKNRALMCCYLPRILFQKVEGLSKPRIVTFLG